MPKEPAADVPSSPITVFAARLAGKEGWIVGEELGDLDAVRNMLAHGGHSILELRSLSTGAVFDWDGTGFIKSGLGSYLGHRAGWVFDDLAGCWRGPGEPITPPASKPAWTETLAVAFSPPIAGWIKVTIAHHRTAALVHLSNVYDPVRDILHFLEAVLTGGHPRISIDEEGVVCEWHTFDPPASEPRDRNHYERRPMIRFVVFSEHGSRADREPGANRSPDIDIVIAREALVAAIYGAWRKIVAAPPERWSREWLYSALEELDRPEHPDGYLMPTGEDLAHLRSEAIEAVLSEPEG